MKPLLLSLVVSFLFVLGTAGCVSTPREKDKYSPDPDNERALEGRLSRMRRQNQGF